MKSNVSANKVAHLRPNLGFSFAVSVNDVFALFCAVCSCQYSNNCNMIIPHSMVKQFE